MAGDWAAEMKADRAAYRAEMKADRHAYRTEARSSRSDWSSSMKAARSDSFMNTKTSEFSDGLSVAAKDLYSEYKISREAESDRSVNRSMHEDKDAPSSNVVPQIADELTTDFIKLMEHGKATMERMCVRAKEVYRGVMAKYQCDCQLKEFYKCVDEEGSNEEKCRPFMEKLFECRKNMRKADSPSQ